MLLRLVLVFCFHSLFAAICVGQNRLDVLEVDEVNGRLLARGHFEDQVAVEVEGIRLQLVSWSDSLIVSTIPVSGPGSGGRVILHVGSDSLSRILTVYSAKLEGNLLKAWGGPELQVAWGGVASLHAQWRADIGTPTTYTPASSLSYVSKASILDLFDESYGSLGEVLLPWIEYEKLTDSCFSAMVTVDRRTSQFGFSQIQVRRNHPNSSFKSFHYYIRPLRYDSTGFLETYYENDPPEREGEFTWCGVKNVEVYYPPFTRSIVLPKEKSCHYVSISEHSLTVWGEADEVIDLSVCDVLGIARFEGSLHSGKPQSISLSPGAYFIRTRTGDRVEFNRKIIF
jgi:hypothetical protein